MPAADTRRCASATGVLETGRLPTDATPGTREAGTIDFLDRYLSGIGFIYARPDGSGFETLTGRSEQAWRTRIAIMRRKYANGGRELDRRSRQRFDLDFAALAPDRQDAVLHDIERGVHTRQGFYADPIYGGNRHPVGWDVIGFPGPRR